MGKYTGQQMNKIIFYIMIQQFKKFKNGIMIIKKIF